MRNLKKILSLALALVMVFSLMTFASAQDFNDAADIEHTEAVEVLTALEVIDGVGNNTFNPNGKVTRAQMAKMITLISLGNVSVDAFIGTTVDLTDISGHWAEAYIKYCYSQGIISGKGNGRFDPDANVTTVEAAKMLLVAIGFNSDVQVYEGPQWNVNVIRDAQTNDIFEELSLASNLEINRDQAAQMMYNALTTGIIEKSSSVSRVDGSIIDEYKKNTDGKTLLSESFKGRVWLGTFAGNKDSGANSVEGQITVNKGALEENYIGSGANASTGTASFPYDFDIANIGEQVKVIFKDGTSGTKGVPDRYDTIYGVYKTGGTTVYNITKADLQEYTGNATDVIKFGGTEYTLSGTSISTWTDYVNTSGSGTSVAASVINDKDTGWRKQDVTGIKFVTDENGKICAAYLTTYNTGRVTSVTSDKITIEGVGSIEIAKNNVYSGAAVDDVVVYTKFYKTAKDDAYFNVALAETVEGELTGYKGSVDNVVVGGITYKVDKKTLVDLSDDEILNGTLDDTRIGDQVRLFLVNGMVAGIQALEESGGKYALVVDVSENGSLSSTLDPIRVTVLLPDGTEQTLKVHKDSVKDGDDAAIAESDLNRGTLVEYSSISEDSIKIYNLPTTTTITGGRDAKLWDKDAKTLVIRNTGSSRTAVAASNATLFVVVDANGSGTLDGSEKYYAYDLRSMGSIANETSLKVSYFLNKDGLVTAAYVLMGNRPTSGGDNTLYGLVTGGGDIRVQNDTTYTEWKVAVGRDSDLTVRVETNSSGTMIAKGDLITFDESSDNLYVKSDFTKLVTDDEATAERWFLGAVNNFSNNILSYYTTTSRTGADNASNTNTFAGGVVSTVTAASDLEIVYVNSKDTKAGDDVGVSKFNVNTGYANILFHTDDDGLVDVMIVESTGEGNIAKAGSDTKHGTASFGVTAAGHTVAAISDSSAGTKKGTYTATVSVGPTDQVAAGRQVTVTVKVKTAAIDNSKDLVTIVSGGDATIVGDAVEVAAGAAVGTVVGTWTFAMPGDKDVDDLSISVMNSVDEKADAPTGVQFAAADSKGATVTSGPVNLTAGTAVASAAVTGWISSTAWSTVDSGIGADKVKFTWTSSDTVTATVKWGSAEPVEYEKDAAFTVPSVTNSDGVKVTLTLHVEADGKFPGDFVYDITKVTVAAADDADPATSVEVSAGGTNGATITGTTVSLDATQGVTVPVTGYSATAKTIKVTVTGAPAAKVTLQVGDGQAAAYNSGDDITLTDAATQTLTFKVTTYANGKTPIVKTYVANVTVAQ